MNFSTQERKFQQKDSHLRANIFSVRTTPQFVKMPTSKIIHSNIGVFYEQKGNDFNVITRVN